MEYVEIRRSRRTLIWWTAIIAAGLAFWTLGVYGKNVHVKGPVPDMPAFLIVAVVTFAAFILASIVSPGLNNEESTIAIGWTRPMPRTTIAWRYIAVDLATIVIGSAIFALAMIAELALAGVIGFIHADGTLWLSIVLAAGCVVMWYALCLVVAAPMPERAGMIAGLSWAVFIVLGILVTVPTPPLVHGLMVALNYLNPLAYFSGSDKGTMLTASTGLKAAIVWIVSIAALTGAVRLWSTREA